MVDCVKFSLLTVIKYIYLYYNLVQLKGFLVKMNKHANNISEWR